METPDAIPHVTLIVLAVFAILFMLERRFPLRRPTRRLFARLVVNGILTASAFATAALLVRPVVSHLLQHNVDEPIGLLHLFPLPAWAGFAAGFVLLDLAFYYWHLLNHRVPVLWRFHNVHHIDGDLDVSTGFRFHFGEVAFSTVFRVVQVAVIGVSPWTFAVYELVFQANTLFHHSNLRLPVWLERPLNAVLVTPRMHGIHHSQFRDETNANYSVVFPWWDRLHRTLKLNAGQSKLTMGVPAYSSDGDNTVGSALLMPFQKQREYWRRPDGTMADTRGEGEGLRLEA